MEERDLGYLVQEFKTIGLTDTDARRSAFCALAYHGGWNTARIGRYLGISRARVGQRIDRLRKYVETRDDVPQLAQLLSTVTPRELPTHLQDLPVGFPLAQWEEEEFAWGMLRQLAETRDT